MIGKILRKVIQQLLLIFCILKKKKYFQLIIQNITQPVKSNDSLNDFKRKIRRMALSSS